MYSQAKSLSRFPCSSAHTQLSLCSVALCNTEARRGIFAAKEKTTVFQSRLKPNEGLKWDLSALFFFLNLEEKY